MRGIVMWTLGVSVALALAGSAPAYGVGRPVSVADMVRYSFIGDPNSEYGGSTYVGYNLTQLTFAAPAAPSSDGMYFAVIVRHGDIADDETKARLEVFETKSVFSGDTRPELVASFASTTVRPPIYGVQWLTDSRRLLFIAEKPRRPPEVYIADVVGGSVKPMTKTLRGVVKFDATPTGSTLALLVPVGASACGGGEKGRKDGYAVTADGLIDVLTGRCRLDYLRQSQQLYVQRGRGPAIRIPDPGDVAVTGRSRAQFRIERCYTMFGSVSISPDGRYAVRTCGIARVPKRWREYDSTGRPGETEVQKVLSFPLHRELHRTQQSRDSGNMTSLLVQQDVIFDLVTGRATLAWDAPLVPQTADMSRPRAWIGDSGHRLVLAGVLVRRDGGGWGSDGQFGPAVVEVNAATGVGRVVAVNGTGVSGVAWSAARHAVVVDYGADPGELEGADLGDRRVRRSRLFRMRQGHWEAAGPVTADAAIGSGIRFKLQQSLNHWPVLVAIRGHSGKKVTVLDPDSWLKHRELATERRFEWSADGYTFEGGLYYPVGYSAGKRYPLVIQTHGFSPWWFSLYGTASSGFAAQPLAGHGFLVAQIGDVVGKPSGAKVDDNLKRFSIEVQGLIAELNRRGMVDPTRVGITGWSSFWLPTENMITFSPVHLAAAVDGDGWDGGYFIYTATDVADGFGDEQWGSPSVGGLRHWLNVVPDFNLERVRTPALVLAPGLDGLQENWEFFAGLRRLGKPVEMFYMPSGSHEIIQPGYWYASAQTVVDWYRFWLEGKEDRIPAKAAQYSRWETFCAQERREMRGSLTELHCPDAAASRARPLRTY